MSASPSGDIAVIVLNWNGWVDTLLCLSSLFRERSPRLRIVVCDNGSTDDSVAMIQAWAERRLSAFAPPGHAGRAAVTQMSDEPLSVAVISMDGDAAMRGDSAADLTILKNGKNAGFAGGNNAAIEVALGWPDIRYVWLLNNDTVVPSSADVDRLADAAAASDDLALVSPRINRLSNPSSVWFEGGRFSPRTATAKHVSTAEFQFAEFPFLTACAMLIPRRTIERVGLLDERFFVYGEDADYCFRARANGCTLIVCDEVTILHATSASSQAMSAFAYRHHVSGCIVVARRYTGSRYILPISLYHLLKLAYLGTIGRRSVARLRGYGQGLIQGLRSPVNHVPSSL